MELRSVMALFGGVGIFLFSVVQMSDAMRAALGERSERTLSRFTKSRLSGVIVGAATTAAVQSSAAVTVTAVSLADCGKLSLSACVGIIMGSNIGTTVTGVLAALDFSFAAPVLVAVGAFAALVAKSERVKSLAFFFCALGLLFVGLETMKEAAAALDEGGLLSRFFVRCRSPLAGVALGFVSTAAAQSSSATVGILQSLVSVGAVSRRSAVFIVCGQNIGATVPTLLSALRANERAKSVAIFHLLFNLFGASGVLFASLFFSPERLFSAFEGGEAFVCAVHVSFNVVCTLALLPLSLPMAQLSQRAAKRLAR